MQVFPRGSRAWFRCTENAATLTKDARANVRCGLRELAHWRDACFGTDGLRWPGGYNVGSCSTETGAHYARRIWRIYDRAMQGLPEKLESRRRR